MMKSLVALIMVLSLAVPTFANHSSDDFIERWDYPNNRAGGVGKSSGLVAFSRAARRTTDPIEKVVLWYADRVGLPADHSLVEAAESGFSTIDSLSIRSNYGHDTDERQDHVSILGSITSEHAHVTLVYQPNITTKSDVVISIAQTPDGTNIHVFRQEPQRPTNAD